ncbi:MAG: TIGR01777 family protein [Proteobacteria bacterium]|nr:TIGR01777 family protein [Pseudomonadota bacterium]NOG60386.1 TIGR01777 family protein [Pseudomonadota bacterium]
MEKQSQNQNLKNILVTGATGFIGQSLCRELLNYDKNVFVLSRHYKKAEKILGTQIEILTNLEQLKSNTQIDAVISLAGAPVVGGLWTQKRKQLLIDSRINDLNAIKALCEQLKHKPKCLINASAIGFYGIRHDELITEKETGQAIFQSELCQQRENAANQFENYGTRVCNLRIGLVFDNDGGAFVQMARPIKFGLGAILGSGQQWMSWIYKPDLIRIILFLLNEEILSGAINATAPEPVTNEMFTKSVAAKFNRPVFLKAPALVLKTMLGELSQLFLEGQRVIPEKLLAAGFEFNVTTLDEMLAAIDSK